MTREEFVQQIKDCGQSIIDNAEKIYNHFDYPTNGVEIRAIVSKNATPVITVENAFIPERYLIGLGINPRKNG